MASSALYPAAVAILKELIATPSFSREEGETAAIIFNFLKGKGMNPRKMGNNVFAFNRNYDPSSPTLLLNSHHDTVKPNKGYRLNPFEPVEKDGKLFGLGSNDAGGCLVALLGAFLHFYERESLPYNLVFAATAEEEISGANGISSILESVGKIDVAIVGEPTQLEMAIAERGLMVLDCEAKGIAGHAARQEGMNALYTALEDIEKIRNHAFDRISDLLGETKMTVTVIQTENQAHNVVPAHCRFVVDVRINELYTHEEVLQELGGFLKSKFVPRSTRIRSSIIPVDHPLVRVGIALGKNYYGSPTTSDKALMPFPALKMGPGDSARSHSADEFIYLEEIREGIDTYIRLIEKFFEESR